MRPNIVYLHSHDTGRYIQPYGYNVPTPNLQKLAEQGMVFRQAFCAGPTCSPSRAALLTGQSAHAAGMLGLAHRGFRLNDYSQHIVHTLRAAGYVSALAGFQHVADHTVGGAAAIGYDEILMPAGDHDNAPHTADRAVEYLQRHHEQPFFLSVGFTATHRDFPEPEAPDDPRWLRPPVPLPDTPETRYDFAAYRTLARRLDIHMGRVLDAIDAAGLADNTLVICTTDHGIAFPLMKCHLTDHGTGVMLLMRGPGGFEGGKVCDALVSQVDLFPTICDLLAIDRPAWLEGVSLRPLTDGSAGKVREYVYSEVTCHACHEPQRAVRDRRYKYIRRYGDRCTPVLPNCDDSPSKDVLVAAGWPGRPVDPEQLYDLSLDPNEVHNLIDDPRCAAEAQRLRDALDDWMRRTNDPLRTSTEPPSGAILNDPDGRSPREPSHVVP